MPNNEYFIGRREVMFQALQSYHSQPREGLDATQQRETLIASINTAAASNGRLNDTERARVALEWEGIINNLPAEQMQNFLNDTKTLAEQPMPNLPRGVDYGTDLSTLDVSNIMAVLAVASRATASGARFQDLQGLVRMNEQFEDAAQRSGIINYEQGESLTAKLDGQSPNITQQALEQRMTALQGIQTEQRAFAERLAQTAGNFDVDQNGRMDLQDAAAILGANPDRNQNGSLSQAELASVTARVQQAVQNNPQLAEVATAFQTALQGMTASEGANAALPNVRFATNITIR